MKENETEHLTPEQLLQMIDLQLASQRSQRAQSGRNRATILVGGILFIIVIAGAALLVLDQMLMDLRPDGRPATATPAQAEGK